MTCLAPAPQQRSGAVQFNCRCVLMAFHVGKASRLPVSRAITLKVIVRLSWVSRLRSAGRLDRRGLGRLVDEASYRLESAVVRQNGEVRADEVQRRILGPARLPLKAHPITILVDAAYESEPVGRGKRLMNGLNHCTELLVAGATPMRIDVAAVLDPGFRE